jgi:hypothetical protein
VVKHPRIIYTPHSNVTQENERDVLASVYAFVLRCHEEKEAAEQSGPNSAKGYRDDRAKAIIR